MKNTMGHLIYLLHTKNTVNLRRRRFLKVMYAYNTWGRKSFETRGNPPSHLTYAQAKWGYWHACQEMRSMSASIRQLKKKLKATTERNSNNAYTKVSNENFSCDSKDFAHQTFNYLAERILLGQTTYLPKGK